MVSLRHLSRTPAVYVIPVKMPGRRRGRTILVPVNQIVPLQELKNVRITTVELVHATQTAELTLQWCARYLLPQLTLCKLIVFRVKAEKIMQSYRNICHLSLNNAFDMF